MRFVVVGFLASTLLRGINYIQIPTTLLAMVDSSVGGKTAINTKTAKNMFGTFHKTLDIILNFDFLKYLPDRQLKAGYAEMLKYGLALNGKYFKKLVSSESQNNDCIKDAIKIKERVIKKDFKEQKTKGECRALLNFGHTFGHAIEKASLTKGEFNHGEAVAIGMRLAIGFGIKDGITKITDNQRDQILDFYSKNSLVGISDLQKYIKGHELEFAYEMVKIMQIDKKNTDNCFINLILLEKIGKAKIVPTHPIMVYDFLYNYLK